jgi:hypothetical protein
MTKRQERVAESQTQFGVFLETARALGCDEDKEKFEAALRKVAAHKPIREIRRARDANKESK